MESQSKRSRGRGRGRGSKARGRGRGKSTRPRAVNKRVCIIESDPEDIESENTVVVEDQGCFQVPAAEDLQVTLSTVLLPLRIHINFFNNFRERGEGTNCNFFFLQRRECTDVRA